MRNNDVQEEYDEQLKVLLDEWMFRVWAKSQVHTESNNVVTPETLPDFVSFSSTRVRSIRFVFE